MTILAIDCQFLAYQALHTMKGLTVDDVPSGVVFGFLSRIANLGEFFGPHVQPVFCWDSKSSVRKEFYSGYKAKRRKDKTPEEWEIYHAFAKQCQALRKVILPQLGFKNILQRKGFEADDLLARVALDNLDTVIIITADQDLWQMISSNTRVFNPSTHVMMTRRRLQQTTGLNHPMDWGWVKVIAGCRGDDVPPIVPGIGQQSAIDYKTGKLKPNSARWKKIESRRTDPAVKKLVARNKELVLLPHKDCTRPVKIHRDAFDMQALKDVCMRYEMRTLVTKDMRKKWRKAFL